MTRAFDLERRGDYAGAAEAYRSVLSGKPADISALLGLERVLAAPQSKPPTSCPRRARPWRRPVELGGVRHRPQSLGRGRPAGQRSRHRGALGPDSSDGRNAVPGMGRGRARAGRIVPPRRTRTSAGASAWAGPMPWPLSWRNCPLPRETTPRRFGSGSSRCAGFLVIAPRRSPPLPRRRRRLGPAARACSAATPTSPPAGWKPTCGRDGATRSRRFPDADDGAAGRSGPGHSRASGFSGSAADYAESGSQARGGHGARGHRRTFARAAGLAGTASKPLRPTRRQAIGLPHGGCWAAWPMTAPRPVGRIGMPHALDRSAHRRG